MRIIDINSTLPLGLYRIHWKTGGVSIAAIGMQSDGKYWVAPTNWVEPSLDMIDGDGNDIWSLIEKLELITDNGERGANLIRSDVAQKLARHGGYIEGLEEGIEYLRIVGLEKDALWLEERRNGLVKSGDHLKNRLEREHD